MRPIATGICALALIVHASECLSKDDEVENIVVTGSRLARSEFTSPSPIVVVPAQLFQQSGAVAAERVLNEMPQFVPTATSTSNAPSNDGQANVSLRGLSPSQTLVLLDGRRVVPADGRGSIDLNVLPPALIERVEVITGGASAVYGSEAIAGVVNFRVVDAFDGVKLDAGWTQTSQNDGDEYTTGITAGTTFAEDRGSIIGYIGYAKRNEIGQSDRYFSRYPLKYYTDVNDGRGPGHRFLGSGSGLVEEGLSIAFASPLAFENLFASYGFAPGTVPYVPGFVVNSDGSIFTIGNQTPGSVVNFRGVKDPVMFNDRTYTPFNYAPYTALQMPLERTTVFSRMKFAPSEGTELYVQVLGADYSVERQLAPAYAGIALIPPTNPHIPSDLATMLAARVVPDVPFRFFKRLTELDPQVADNDRDVGQATTGMRGHLSDEWRYDAYLQIGRNERTERQTGNVVLSRFQELTFAADAGASICGDFDPFRPGSLPADCADYVTDDASNKITVDQDIAEVSVNGPLWSLPAGALQGAFGVFYKKDTFDYDADPVLSAMLPAVPGVIGPRPDLAGFEAAPDRHGDESNVDVYFELLVPILSEARFAKALDLGLGYRYSDYENAGGVSSYKAEAAYQPLSGFRVRGSYQHTVRAPSVEELFYPHVEGQFFVTPPDPCSASSAERSGSDRAQVEALCLAQGLPAALLPTFEYPLARVEGFSGGNPELDPEQADTYTFGVVVAGTLDTYGLGDLTLSIDWYRIDIEDGIGRWEADSAIDRCFNPTFNPTYSTKNVYCTFFERNAESGQIYASIIDRNIGGVRTSGIDLQLNWVINVGPGTLSVNENVAYVDEWQYRDPSGGVIEYAGTIGGGGLGRSLPEWKSLLDVSYRLDRITLFAKWQHVGEQNDVEFENFEVPGRDYFGLSASYEVDSGRVDGLTARVGVENLFDENPPIFPSWEQANTDPSQYDVLGRRYFISVSYRV